MCVVGPFVKCAGAFRRGAKRELRQALCATRDRIRESIIISLTMGLNADYVLHQPFKTHDQIQNDQSSFTNFPLRRHSNLHLRAAAPQIVAKHRRRRRRLSTQCGKGVKLGLMFCDNLRGRFSVYMGKQCNRVSAVVIMDGPNHILSTRGSGHVYPRAVYQLW